MKQMKQIKQITKNTSNTQNLAPISKLNLSTLSTALALALATQNAQAQDTTFSSAMLENIALTHLRNTAITDSMLDSMTRKSFHSNYGKKTAVGELKEAEESIRNRDYDYEAIEVYVASKVAKEKIEITKLESKLESLNAQHNDLREKDIQVAIEAEKDKQKEVLIQKAKILAEQKAKTALQSKIQAHEREKQRLARLETEAKNKAQAKLQAQEREQIATKNKQRDSQIAEQNALASKLQNQITQSKSHKANLAKTLEQESARINAEIRQLQKDYQADAQIKNLTPTQKATQKERQRDIASLDAKLKNLNTKTKQESQNQDALIANSEKELLKVNAKQKEIKSAYERDIDTIKERTKQEYQAQASEIAKQHYLAPLDTKAELESLRAEHTQIEVAKAQNTEIKLTQNVISAIQTRLRQFYTQPNAGKNPEIAQTKNQIEQAKSKLKEKEAFFTAQAKLEQDKKKQLELDSVRVDLSEVNKIRLKGVDLDKQEWTNQQILDALDRVFIPYYGDKKQHFFITPYATHTYLNTKVKGHDIGGGILAGIERNLGPLSGRFGAYIGYDFSYLATSIPSATDDIGAKNQNHGINGGLTYFKPFATHGTNEWFIKTTLRGGGRFLDSSASYERATQKPQPDMLSAWNVGLDIRAGKKFYSVKRNSYFSPEFGISYDMLQTLKWNAISGGGSPQTTTYDTKEVKSNIFHLPQARVQIHYHKALRNTFRFSSTLGVVYNMLYNPTVSYLNHNGEQAKGRLYLSPVYGVADINLHWALRGNTELTLGYTGAYFSSAISSALMLKVSKWF